MTIRRWEQAGKLTAARVEGGVHLYRAEDIRRLCRTQGAGRTDAPAEANDGEIAATVFAELDAGTPPTTIVQKLKIAPASLRALVSEWQALGGGIYLTRPDLAALERKAPYFRSLRDRGVAPMEALTAIVETVTPPCPKCDRPTVYACTRCTPARDAFRFSAADAARDMPPTAPTDPASR